MNKRMNFYIKPINSKTAYAHAGHKDYSIYFTKFPQNWLEDVDKKVKVISLKTRTVYKISIINYILSSLEHESLHLTLLKELGLKEYYELDNIMIEGVTLDTWRDITYWSKLKW